ncbi:MAG TPA: CaiB/BaiF CoA-transferase family protein [Stellaceae bacterium]|nr:CaiB/BaiF CoA-transferase family protein [Stellaceae bacterium]
MRPFEGIRIIDITHVLAGPFAAYQLAVLGADVIKVEHPDEPDQSREGGTDRALNRRNMGTSFLTQGSNKKSITLDLKSADGRDILKKLVASADVLVQNYRPGAFEALGLGYEALLKVNPRLIYCSISAFGQDGTRREQTAYDHVIQATSGIMASTGTEEVNPIKIGAPAVDYATGTMGAFALSAALFQRERTGKGQHIDLAMLGVAMMMQASLMAGYFRNGSEPKPHGNKQPFATNSAYDAKEGMVMIGASNIRQQARFWQAVGREDMSKTDNESRVEHREAEATVIAEIIKTKTADEWEEYFQARHVPAARVRTMAEALADPHFATRGVWHSFDRVPGIDGPVGVPLAAFKFAHGGPSIEQPPHEMGEDTAAVLGELGYDAAAIARLREAKVI